MGNDITPFTSGPWFCDLASEDNRYEVYDQNYKRIAIVTGQRGAFQANALLIAAAPEMVDVLRRAAEQLAHCLGNENPIVIEARTLLAKAGAL